MRRTSAVIASPRGCLTRQKTTLFSPQSFCQPVELWAPRWWLSSKMSKASGRAKEAEKFLMSQQPALKHSWNTMVASSFWDMHLSIACASTDAEYQNRIILHVNTLNLPSWRSSPIPIPTMRRTRRRPALPAPKGSALACRCLNVRSSQLHAAAWPACCTAL